MDPITQGVLGATYAQSFIKNKSHHKMAMIFGFLAGMAADLDVIIRSSSDTLLFLEYHRQFTHSLIFIPLGALICSLVFYYISKKTLQFKYIYLYSFLGYATHALLDSCTSYGTQLFWPFSNHRVAWNNVSIIDPLYTIPLLILMYFTYKKKAVYLSRIAVCYSLLFLLIGVFQRERVVSSATLLATSRGHNPTQIYAKPSFGNMILWKTFYKNEKNYYVDAIRATNSLTIYPGTSIKVFNKDRDIPSLQIGSTLDKDIERFSWFSKGFIALNPDKENQIIDIRYSIIPNEIKALWGIDFDLSHQGKHAYFNTQRKVDKTTRNTYFQMLLGK